jgi:hypothetical protein
MDFGEILERWEKGKARGEEPVDMETALKRYPPAGEAEAREREAPSRPDPARQAGSLKALKSQAVLDLHGLSSAEAEEALDRFIRDSRSRGL